MIIETITIRPVKDKLYFTNKTNEWCQLPYPRHKKGCPNYNKSDKCPPKARPLNQIFDLKKDHYFLINKFNLKKHIIRMKFNNPKLTINQAKCVLYWQNKVKAHMRYIFRILLGHDIKLIYNDIPEAHGVNVIKTLRKLNINVEIKPLTYVHKVALIGYPNRLSIKQKELSDYIKFNCGVN